MLVFDKPMKFFSSEDLVKLLVEKYYKEKSVAVFNNFEGDIDPLVDYLGDTFFGSFSYDKITDTKLLVLEFENEGAAVAFYWSLKDKSYKPSIWEKGVDIVLESKKPINA